MLLLLLACRASLLDDDSDAVVMDTEAETDAPGDTDDETDRPEDTDTGDGPVDADADGFTADQDCDDADASVYPGAPESCPERHDRDCDGAPPECTTADADWSFVGDYRATAWGGVASDGDVDGDGVADLLIGSPGDDLGDCLGPGRVYVVSGGRSYGLDTPLGTAAAAIILGSDCDELGSGLVYAGDMDGDGKSEVLTSSDAGVFGFQGAALSGPIDASDAWLLPGDGLTRAAMGTDDMTGDGVRDLVAEGTGPSGAFGAFVFSGAMLGGPLSVDDASMEVTSADVEDCGDLDGDGTADLVVEGESEVAVFLGPQPGGLLVVSDRDLSITAGGRWSFDASITPDVDGDARSELLLADLDFEGSFAFAGRAWILPGDISTLSTVEAGDVATAWYTGDYEGDAVARVPGRFGDRDGDGLADAAIGGGHGLDGAKNIGRICLFESSAGQNAGGWLLSEAARCYGGTDTDALLYYRPAAAGDLDADGSPDLVTYDPMWSFKGKVHVFLAW